MGGGRGRVFSRQEKVFKGAGPVMALLKVHSQFRSNLVNAIAINRDSSFSDVLVNLGTAHRSNHSVRHFSIEDMNETMTRGNGPVRQFNQPRGGQKLMPSCQFFAMF